MKFVKSSPTRLQSATWKIGAFSSLLMAMMVDCSAEYMPDAQSYDRFTYEARSSPFAKGAASGIVEHIIRIKESGN